MQLIVDAGFTGIIIVFVFVIALAAQVAGRSTSSTSWALGLLSLGAVGHSLGQRAVRDAVLSGADRGVDVGVIVAQGSAEASANLLLAGAAALVVVAVGAAHDRAVGRS